MYTISSDSDMPTQKPEPPPPHQNISVRLPSEEFERYREVLRRGLSRNPLADKTKIIRELLGLESYGLLKDKDIAYFRGKPDITQHLPQRHREVPIMGRVAAGRPIERLDRDKTVAVDPELIKTNGDVCALTVEGESMIDDHILNGDVLICRPTSPNDVRPNAITVVELKDLGATVKRWKRKGQSVTLGSETYNVKQIARVFEVAGLIRKMK